MVEGAHYASQMHRWTRAGRKLSERQRAEVLADGKLRSQAGKSFVLVHCLKNGFTPADFLEDRVDRGGPDEWLGVVVVGGEERFDRLDEVGDAVKDAAADRFVGELAKPALDEV